ncbi:MAG: hypothetical protein ABIO32_03170 [Ferruginibacter sp.]
MIITNIKDKVMKGGKLAIDRLLEQKRKENSFIVVSHKGKVVRLNANDIKK